MEVTQQPYFFSKKSTVKMQMSCLIQQEEDINNATHSKRKH